MSEKNLDEVDLTTRELQVRVEHGGFAGIAWLKRVGHEALKWHINIYHATKGGTEICHFEGPDIVGDGPVLVTIDDVERAQHEINKAIDQFIWDPMSTA